MVDLPDRSSPHAARRRVTMTTGEFGREIIEAFEACMMAASGRGVHTTYRDAVAAKSTRVPLPSPRVP